MIKQAMTAYAQANQRLWAHDRTQTIGASEIGQCARKTYWSKNEGDTVYGTAQDRDHIDGWGAKVRGSFYENTFWAPAIKAAFGDKAFYVGEDQETFVDRFLSGTPDGLLIDQPRDALKHLGVDDIETDCIDLDCKTADPRTNLAEPKPEHVYQVQVQLGLIRTLTDFKPVYGLLSYTDASFWDLILEFPVKFNADIYEAAQARAAMIMTATDPSDLKPEGWIAGGRECEYCPFTKACGIQRRSVPEDNAAADPQFIAEISDMARAVKELEFSIESTESSLRAAQQKIKDRLREKGVRKIPGLLTWFPVKGRPSWDNKGIREAAESAGVDLSVFEKTGEPSDGLRITLKTNPASPDAGVFPA